VAGDALFGDVGEGIHGRVSITGVGCMQKIRRIQPQTQRRRDAETRRRGGIFGEMGIFVVEGRGG
jgi:hypothetical protein